MFTVKLVRGDAVKIVAGASVEISPLAGGDGREVAVTDTEGNITRYEVARDGLYLLAYVENAQGQTTQIVRPR